MKNKLKEICAKYGGELKEIYAKYGGTIDIIVWIVTLLIIWSIVSCKSIVYEEKPVYIHDTTNVSVLKHDSVWMHDSVWSIQWMKGDTVFLDKGKIEWKYKEKKVHDTIRQVEKVPIEIEKPVIKEIEKKVEVEKELNWWQRWMIRLGEFALALLGIVLGLIVYKVVSK